ncbi:hypothetical protein [Kushneria phosphatilytica]|nr:hypothetical protein [Kushneria phosphatilytica]
MSTSTSLAIGLGGTGGGALATAAGITSGAVTVAAAPYIVGAAVAGFGASWRFKKFRGY